MSHQAVISPDGDQKGNQTERSAAGFQDFPSSTLHHRPASRRPCPPACLFSQSIPRKSVPCLQDGWWCSRSLAPGFLRRWPTSLWLKSLSSLTRPRDPNLRLSQCDPPFWTMPAQTHPVSRRACRNAGFARSWLSISEPIDELTTREMN